MIRSHLDAPQVNYSFLIIPVVSSHQCSFVQFPVIDDSYFLFPFGNGLQRKSYVLCIHAPLSPRMLLPPERKMVIICFRSMHIYVLLHDVCTYAIGYGTVCMYSIALCIVPRTVNIREVDTCLICFATELSI